MIVRDVVRRLVVLNEVIDTILLFLFLLSIEIERPECCHSWLVIGWLKNLKCTQNEDVLYYVRVRPQGQGCTL